MSAVHVLEFDGSLLTSNAAITAAVHDIYRELRRRHCVAAVVSCPAGSPQREATQALAGALDEGGVPHIIKESNSAKDWEERSGGSPDEARVLIVTTSTERSPRGIFAAAVPPAQAPLNIVLLGLGTVGLGVYRHLSARPELFDVRRVVVRDPIKHRDDGVPPGRLSTNLWHAINEPADVVIELAGGIEPLADVVHAALLRGRAVVTANKALIATRWDTLECYACAPDPRLRFSAAVGGALPVLETIARLTPDRAVASVRAVINGTCNFVLDELAGGASLAAAVARAQRLGFAEADPRADLSGADAAQKLCLITRAAFAATLNPGSVDCHGIEHLTPAAIAAAKARGRRIRLVASCSFEQRALHPSVRPEELDASDYLAGTRGEENRVELITTTGDTLRLSGKGAGRWPTALSVMGDVYDCLESHACGEERWEAAIVEFSGKRRGLSMERQRAGSSRRIRLRPQTSRPSRRSESGSRGD